MGNAPKEDESGMSFSDVPCTIYVPKTSTGWGVNIPGEWKGVPIRYLDDEGGETTPTITHTVTFNANGGTGSTTRTVADGKAVGTLPTPTWIGYKFAGWYTASSGGMQISASTVVTANVTYYAHWTEIASDLQFYTEDLWDAPMFISIATEDHRLTDSVIEGQTIYFNYRFQNYSNKSATGFQNMFYLNGKQLFMQDWSSYTFYCLDRGGLTMKDIQWLQNLAPGKYTLTCVLNDSKALKESDYDNNTYSMSFTVRPASPVKYDIGFSALTGRPSSLYLSTSGTDTTAVTRFVQGDNIYIHCGCRNLASTDDLVGFSVVGRLNNKVSFTNNYFQSRHALRYGQTCVIESGYWHPKELKNLSPGIYTLTVVLDSGNKIRETDESNNTRSVTFIVTAPGSDEFQSKILVAFGKNGGTGGDDYVTATYGNPLPTPRRSPTRVGYVFDGYWDSTKAGGKQYYDANMKSVRNWDKKNDTTLWAKWSPVRSKVTFGKNGGTGGDNYVTAMYGAAMPTPRTAPKLSGYTFAGYWDTLALDAKGNPKGKQYYDANMKSVRKWDKTSAATLWAKWTNKVTFGKNGGTGGDNFVTVTKGQPMPKRTMPTKSGYVFEGYWTTTGAGGVKYYNADGTSAHAWDKKGDTTLWAKWRKPAVVKVTFGKNGGTSGDSYVTVTEGAAMPIPRTAPRLSGYTFAGYWDTLALDAKGNPKGKQYYDANMKSVRKWDKQSATTLWAKWTNKVTFGKNGGTGGDNYVTCTKGQPMPKRTMPTKSGYFFDGYWTTTGTGGVKYYNSDGTSAHVWDRKGSVTLWAKWVKPVACKVTLGKNGGTGGDNYVTATTGKPMPTPRTAPKRAGWTFGGYWDTLSCDAKGNPLGKQYYDANMKSVRVWDKTSTATLWAKWTVRVKLGKNGGTGGDDYATVIYNQPFPKRTMPKKPGYTFGGYFVSASRKTGQCYNPDGTGTASMKWSTGGTPTIWALWTKTSACVELPPAVARRAAAVAVSAPSASAAPAPEVPAIPAGIYSGVLADGSGAFWLVLDEAEKDAPRTAFLYVASEDGALTAECTAEELGGVLLLTTKDGEVYAFDPVAGSLGGYVQCVFGE